MNLVNLIILILIIAGLNSCDNCSTNTTNSDKNIHKIYFTASINNTNSTSVFSIDKDLRNTKELISNAIIYSEPSNNGYIAYISTNQEKEKSLYIYNLNDNSSTLVAKESLIFGIFYPILSPDGLRLAINAGDSKLIIYNNDNSGTFNQISSSFEDNSTVAFSPDSKLLAFIEKLSNTSFKVKVIDAANNSSINTIFEKIYTYDIITPYFYYFLSWDQSSSKLSFAFRDQDSSYIHIINVLDKQDTKISFNTNNINFYGFKISPNANYAAFTNNDGNLWIMKIKDNDYNFYKITNVPSDYFAIGPNWADDGSKILFSLINRNNQELYNTLMLADIRYETNITATSINLVSNNVFKGYIK